MKLTADTLLRLLSPFYTNAGKQLCLGLVQAGYIKPESLLKQSPVVSKKEPSGNGKEGAEKAGMLADDWAWGIVSDDRRKTIKELAEEEAKPVLLAQDIGLMRKLL